MDERLSKALEFSKYRIALFNRKEDLKTKVDNMLVHAHNGGIFKCSRDLITFVKLMIDRGHDSVILIDQNGNPIQVSELETFLDDVISKYGEATNYFYTEYTKLRNARSVKSIYEFIDD